MIGELLIAATIALTPMPAATPAGQDMDYIGTYRITAYNYYEGGGENYYTAGGYAPVPYYTVAAPQDIDMGTILYIDGVGEVQVQDRGNFPADRLDLHIGYDPIESWDDRYRDVWVVKEGAGCTSTPMQ